MYENLSTVGIGLVLVIAGLLAKGVSYGMPPHRKKPQFPATRRLRIVLVSLGLLFIELGSAREPRMWPPIRWR